MDHTEPKSTLAGACPLALGVRHTGTAVEGVKVLKQGMARLEV
jgi:hypothetical protein